MLSVGIDINKCKSYREFCPICNQQTTMNLYKTSFKPKDDMIPDTFHLMCNTCKNKFNIDNDKRKQIYISLQEHLSRLITRWKNK